MVPRVRNRGERRGDYGVSSLAPPSCALRQSSAASSWLPELPEEEFALLFASDPEPWPTSWFPEFSSHPETVEDDAGDYDVPSLAPPSCALRQSSAASSWLPELPEEEFALLLASDPEPWPTLWFSESSPEIEVPDSTTSDCYTAFNRHFLQRLSIVTFLVPALYASERRAPKCHPQGATWPRQLPVAAGINAKCVLPNTWETHLKLLSRPANCSAMMPSTTLRTPACESTLRNMDASPLLSAAPLSVGPSPTWLESPVPNTSCTSSSLRAPAHLSSPSDATCGMLGVGGARPEQPPAVPASGLATLSACCNTFGARALASSMKLGSLLSPSVPTTPPAMVRRLRRHHSPAFTRVSTACSRRVRSTD